MTRVALVTGGTRGIGAAISIALQEAGYRVAASYVGNDDVARAFREKTGIPVYRWDIRDYQACKEGIARVEDNLGPSEVLVVAKVGQVKEQDGCAVGLVMATGNPKANETARKIADEQARGFACGGDERVLVC